MPSVTSARTAVSSRGIEVEDQFIMHLQEHAGVELLFGQCVLHVHHGDFDHVGGGALDRHVDRVALCGGADGAIS